MMDYGKDRAAAYQDAYSYAMRAAGEDSGMNAAGDVAEAREALGRSLEVAKWLGVGGLDLYLAKRPRSWPAVKTVARALSGVVFEAARVERIDAPTGHKLPAPSTDTTVRKLEADALRQYGPARPSFSPTPQEGPFSVPPTASLPAGGHVRFIKKFRLKAPNAVAQSGGGYLYVVPGMVISYGEAGQERTGRVLDRPLFAGDGRKFVKPHLRVLQLSDTMCFGFLRYVPLKAVRDGTDLPRDFLALFAHPDLTGELVEAMGNYGSLNEAYSAKDWLRRTGKALRPADETPPQCKVPR